MVYKGKKWEKDTQLKYWKNRKERNPLNEKVEKMMTEVFTQVSIDGINSVITKKNLKKMYKKYCE